MKREFKVEGATELNPSNYGGMCSRAVVLERKEVDFEKGIETIATTEAPALVVDWERWQVVREILPMKYCEMPANDKVPFLDSHNRYSLDLVKGSAKGFKAEGQNLMCRVFISESESDLRQKIKEGHVDSVSIGYQTDRAYTVEIPKKGEVAIDGVKYRNDFEDSYPMVVRTWWKTQELSGVAIGADEAAKFKSQSEGNETKYLEKLQELQRQIDELKAPKEDKERLNVEVLKKKQKLREHALNG